MLSSGQVSQMFSQQNQQFSGNAMYSQQISQQMPSMYSGSFGQMSGPSGFSYGGQAQMGYDFASRTSGGAVSAMGGAAQFALGAGGLMAGLGMGGPMRYALDPFAGAGAMYRAGGAMGMGMGGSLAMGAVGMIPALAVAGGIKHAIGSVMGGAQEQAGIDRVLGQNFNFANPSSGGRGFSRQQSMAIGDMVRQLDHMPEMMTSMGELTRIMDKMGQMGVMNGATNVKEFGTKFKSTLNVLKEMSKVIGSTMEEALPLFGEIRRSGMYSNADIMKNAMQRQVVGGLTGMNQGQVGAVAGYGSQLGFATGGSRATGAQHALRVAGQLGMANQMGILSNDQIMEMTGMEGAEGIQALSGQISQASYKISGSALGTAMSIAMAEKKDGKFTGKMDAKLMEQFRSGQISKSQMLSMLHSKTADRGSKMSYVTKRGALRSEMAGQMGVEGQMNMLQMVLGERGYDNPDALNLVSQGFGLDEREAGMLVELGQKMPDINMEMKQRGRTEAKRIAQQAFMKENYSWDSLKTKVGKKIEGVITEPFKKFGAELRNTINNAVDDFVDDVTGKYKVEVTAGMSSLMRGAGSNLGDSRSRLASILGGSAGKTVGSTLGGGVNMSAGGLGSAMNWMTGNKTAGSRAIDAMNLTVVGKNALETADNMSDVGMMRGQGYNTLDTDHGLFRSPVRTMATDRGMQTAAARLSGLSDGSIGMGDSTLSAIARDSGFGAAKADLISQEAFGKSLGGLGALSDKYARGDVVAAIAGSGGGASGMLGAARSRLGADADLLSMTPDRQEAISRRIRGFEKGGAERIFGSAEGADAFMSSFKDIQGSKAGQFLSKTYLRDFGSGSASWQQGQIGTAGKAIGGLMGVGGEGMGREMMAKGLGWAGSYMGMGSALTERGQDMARGRGDDSRDDYFKGLAVKEMAGIQLSSTDKSEIAKNREAYEGVKDQLHLAEVVAKGKTGSAAWTKDDKALLSKMGFDNPDDFTPAQAEKFGKINELMNKAKLDPKARKELDSYLSDTASQSIIEVGQRFQAHGKEVGAGVKGLLASKLDIGGKEGASMLNRVQAYADRLSGAKDLGSLRKAFGIGGGTSIAEDVGGLATDLLNNNNLSHEQTMRIVGTDQDLEAAYSRASYTKNRLKSRKGFSDFFSESGKLTGDDAARLGSIKDKYFDGKGQLKDEKGFVKFMASEEGQKTLTAAGAEERSKYASQADIAKNMESFGQSVASLAQIVQTMKDGKDTKKP